ncbi:cyclin-domain-containing protein, partial [Phycomyces nitens]
FDLANYPTKDTVKLLTCLLEKVATANDHLTTGSSSQDSLPAAHSPYTCFHARTIPTITLQAYLVRILKYCPCANECLLALLVYFDRMAVHDPNQASLRINSYNIHRLVIAGIMVSSKFFSDVFYTNTRYAKVGGLPVAELNSLELEFLHLNHYSLFIHIDELQQYGNRVLLHWNQVHAVEKEDSTSQ